MEVNRKGGKKKLTKTAEKVLVVLCDTVRIEKKDQREFKIQVQTGPYLQYNLE